MATQKECPEISEAIIEQAILFLEAHPGLIPNEIIFKGLRRLITNDVNQASILGRSDLEEYLEKHPEENFLLRVAIDGYATIHDLRLVADKPISSSIREGRALEAKRKKRPYLVRVLRSALNLDSQETTALIREHECLASEVVALEAGKIKLEGEVSALGREAGFILQEARKESATILEKTRSEAQKRSDDAENRAKEVILESGARSERMLKDAINHIEATHKEKTREIEKLKTTLDELVEEIAIKTILASELSQNPEIVKEWEIRHTPKPKPDATSLERVREIMGDHLIDLGEAEKYLGFQFTGEQRESLFNIPWSEEELKEWRGTRILIPGFPMTILEIRDKVPDNTFYSYKDAWYNGEKCATEEKIDCRWYWIRKDIVPDSTSKSFEEQQVLLSEQEVVPRVCEMVYMMALYYLARNQKLFIDKWARCINLSSHGYRVVVSFYDGRLFINYWNDGLRSGNLGLASSRKFPKK